MGNSYIEKIVKVMCRGRTLSGEPVLTESVEVEVRLYRSPDTDMCCSDVSGCPHNAGEHGQRCKASHQLTDKDGDGAFCPFAFDYPYALVSTGWKMPEELRETVEAIMLVGAPDANKLRKPAHTPAVLLTRVSPEEAMEPSWVRWKRKPGGGGDPNRNN